MRFIIPFACSESPLHYGNGMLAVLKPQCQMKNHHTWRHKRFISSAVAPLLVLRCASWCSEPSFYQEYLVPKIPRVKCPVFAISLSSFGLLPPGWSAWRGCEAAVAARLARCRVHSRHQQVGFATLSAQRAGQLLLMRG